MAALGIIIFCLVLLFFLNAVQCQTIPPQNGQKGEGSFTRKEMLDPRGKYVLEWTVDFAEQTITFNITAETLGWVGFGLSNGGKMSGADVMIGGMFTNGLAYFSDRHAVENQVPVEDPSQDWTLVDCVESASGTFISVRRKFDTCDPQDYPISENRVSLIWAYGKTDKEIKYHESNRGSYDVYLLDPSMSPRIVRDRNTKDPTILDMTGLNTPEDLMTWTIPRNMSIPKNETSYFCSMHRGPDLSKKHHVIGFDVYFPDEVSRARVHHLDIYKCNVPIAGLPNTTTSKSLFGPFVGAEPEVCYDLLTPTGGSLPTQYCTEYYMGWAVGGRSFFNPPHVGFPLGTDAGDEEYFLVQVHYDNPNEDSNVTVDLRMDLFFTGELRPNEGGMLLITHNIPGQPESFLLPPNSQGHRIYGHCSPECTRRILGPGGNITVYGALLHSHNSGKRLRLHHFRGGAELPWIVYDDNWSTDYQQFRNLREEKVIMAGDQLTVDCSYDTTWANGSTVVGGYSTKQEMCLAYIVYYNRIRDYNTCASQEISEANRRRFLNGLGAVTWNQTRLNWVALEPNNMAGQTIPQISESFVVWDEQARVELQREQTLRPHQGMCYREPFSRNIPILPFEEGLSEDDFRGPVHYPLEVAAYFGPQKQQCN